LRRCSVALVMVRCLGLFSTFIRRIQYVIVFHFDVDSFGSTS
jgi:hypothetical protein